MPPAIFLLLIIKQIAQQVLYFWVCGQHEGILIVYLCQCFFFQFRDFLFTVCSIFQECIAEGGFIKGPNCDQYFPSMIQKLPENVSEYFRIFCSAVFFCGIDDA